MKKAFSAARRGNFKEAYKLFQIEAQRGNPEAQYRLAGMYRLGQGTAKNDSLAREWYSKAAKLGHAKAQKRLATFEVARSIISGEDTLNPELMKASQKGQISKVGSLINAGASVNYQDDFGMTALIESVRTGHGDIAELLLKHGADPNMQNRDQDTALLIAATQNRLAIAKMLIKYGADINSRDHNNSTALIRAVIKGSLPMAGFLLKKGADIFVVTNKGRSAYDIALANKNVKLVDRIKLSGGQKLVQLLHKKDADQSLNQLNLQAESIQKRGWTPIMYGAWRGDIDAVGSQIAQKPDLEYQDVSGMTVLSLAAQGGHLEVINLLLDAGASLRCGNDTDNHAFFLAVKQGHTKVAARLMPKLKNSVTCSEMLEKSLSYSLLNGQVGIANMLLEADISFVNSKSLSPLILMAAKADDNLIKLLIRSGVAVDAVNALGETALMVAARNGNEIGLRSLIKNKAKIDIKDASGRTALIHASQNGHNSCIGYLAEVGSDVLSITNGGNTALMLAAEKGHVPVVTFFSQYKNLDHKNTIGDTALIMAARANNYAVVEVLLKQGADPRLKNNKREKALTVVDMKNKKLLGLIEEYESSRSWLQDVF